MHSTLKCQIKLLPYSERNMKFLNKGNSANTVYHDLCKTTDKKKPKSNNKRTRLLLEKHTWLKTFQKWQLTEFVTSENALSDHA